MAEGRLVRAGSVEELIEKEAHTLIMLGKAEKVEAEAEQPAAADEPVEAQAEELNTDNAEAVIAEEAPRRGKRSKKD